MGLEDLLNDLDVRLKQNGYTGYFKKMSDWASFVLFIKGIFIGIGNLFAWSIRQIKQAILGIYHAIVG